MKISIEDFAFEPERAHDADAGLDLKSPFSFQMSPHGNCLINTGIHISIPKGYVGFLKSRSSLNVKHDIQCEGVIDSGYSGPIKVKLHNLGDNQYHINPGDKIAQIVILPVLTPKLEYVTQDKVEKECSYSSDRQDGGFGSTSNFKI